MTGKIKRLVNEKGFGFILGADGTEYFFHRSALKNCTWDDVKEGQEITAFEDVTEKKGPRADDVFVNLQS